MSEHRIGDVEITDVVQVEHSIEVVRELNHRQRTSVVEKWTFRRTGDAEPPEIGVPREARVIAFGRDFGRRQICCVSRGSGPGGYLVVKASD